jgi:hypothetical protein
MFLAAYVISVIGVFIYWAVQNVLLRGALFYTIHGVTDGNQGMANRVKRERHFDFHIYGFIVFIVTSFIGFLLTLGWPLLHIY